MLIKKKRKFIVKCPQCHKNQQIEVEGHPIGHYKRCCFCNKNFPLHKNPQNSNIVKELEK